MTEKQLSGVSRRLERFLHDLVEPMGRSERRHWAQVYIQGLLLDGQRKSVQPIAERIAGADEQALNQFLNQSPWEVTEIQRRLARRLADDGAGPVYWVIDETSFPKAGKQSVGVARQYCGAQGKIANCQVAVSLHWSQNEVSHPVSWRLFLPQEWTADPARRRQARIPPEAVHRTKQALALELIDQAQAWSLPGGTVLADSAYGNDFEFRAALRARKLSYAVAVEPSSVVWLEEPSVPLPPRTGKKGRPWRHPPLADMPAVRSLLAVAGGLPPPTWRTVTWRAGTKGAQLARCGVRGCAVSTKAPPARVREWLLIQWPKDQAQPCDYWLLWRPANDSAPSLRSAAHAARGRWRIEQDYRELKDELGLDHFEGRGWLGWHHHVTLVSLAFCFLRSEQARAKKNFRGELADDAPPAPSQPDQNGGPMSVVPGML
ncbi:IS701 family transposase [Termitidicoccus mucosus]|uniref:IS701 family transposase n=1 Tax=Termitidicoccus mucosus TaxID=1184151 RepID=UPI003182E459